MTAVTEEELQDWQNLGHNDVTRPLAAEVMKAIEAVNAYNEEHSDDSNKLSQGDVHKMIRQIAKGEFKPAEGQAEPDAELVKAAKAFVKAEEAFNNVAKETRKTFKKTVLNEEGGEEETSADEAQIREIRRVGYSTLSLLVDMSKVLGLNDVHDYFRRLGFPQVLREGVSMVGVSKPRAQVRIGKDVYDNFSPAAKALSEQLSTEDTKVEIDANELIIAWQDAGSPVAPTPWVFKNTELVTIPKETGKKDDKKSE